MDLHKNASRSHRTSIQRRTQAEGHHGAASLTCDRVACRRSNLHRRALLRPHLFKLTIGEMRVEAAVSEVRCSTGERRPAAMALARRRHEQLSAMRPVMACESDRARREPAGAVRTGLQRRERTSKAATASRRRWRLAAAPPTNRVMGRQRKDDGPRVALNRTPELYFFRLDGEAPTAPLIAMAGRIFTRGIRNTRTCSRHLSAHPLTAFRRRTGFPRLSAHLRAEARAACS